MPFVVTTSRMLQTNVTVLSHSGQSLVIDAPYFPDELRALRDGVPGQVRLFATHFHFDHLLGRLAFPTAPLLVGMPTAQALALDPEQPLKVLRHEDERYYVSRDEPLRFGIMQGLPVPGEVEIGGEWVELVPAAGHTADGTALWAPWAGLLCLGDYLSDVELPWLAPEGSRDGYRATLERLRLLIEQAATIVPGHGSPCDSRTALRRWEEDVAYLDALGESDPNQPLPAGRDTARQREIHKANVKRQAPPVPKKPRARKKLP